MEAVTLTTDPLNALPLRERISSLREQILAVTTEYRLAKSERRSDQIAALLRKRSELTRLLFQTQRELLLSFRASPVSVTEPVDPSAPSESVLYPE